MNTKEYVKIAELLNEFCIPKHLLGYRMILNAIYILSQDPNISVIELYEKVAEMNNSNVSRTERAIRYAIEEAYENCKMYNINTFKRVSFANGKPSNHEFLKALCFEYELSQVCYPFNCLNLYKPLIKINKKGQRLKNLCPFV